MTDRITLIARVGAQIERCLELGDIQSLMTADVLRAALAQLVEDASMAALAERKKEKDRNRKPRKSRNSTESTESAEFHGTPPPATEKKAGHITRALAFELQEQDQKQEQEIANAISPGETPGNGDNAAAVPEIPGSGALELYADPPNPPLGDPPWFDPARIFGVGMVYSHSLSPKARRRAVDYVVAHFVARHPRRRPGEKDRKLIEKHLRTYTPSELCAAIDGNADDEWAKGIGKHELSWTLRDNGKIDDYRERADKSSAGAERIAAEIESSGWIPTGASG